MHRELKRETARPAATSLAPNSVASTLSVSATTTSARTKGSGTRTPSSLWCPSSRAYPEHRIYPDYAARLEIRRVSTAGTFRLQSHQPLLSHALSGEDIGLEEVGDGIWNIVYYRTLLGKMDERTSRMTGIRPGA
jgi:putative transposase